MSRGQKAIVKISGEFRISGGIPPGTTPRIITGRRYYCITKTLCLCRWWFLQHNFSYKRRLRI